MILFPLTTKRTESVLQAWIESSAALPERHSLVAWLAQAEQSASNAGQGDIVLEMPRISTTTGQPSTINLARDLFDWVEIE
jgi:hypothetical protein